MKTTRLSTLLAATCFALGGCAPEASVQSLEPVAPNPFGDDQEAPDDLADDGEVSDLSGLVTDVAAPDHHVPGEQPAADPLEPGLAPGGSDEPDAPADPDMPNWSLAVLAVGPTGDQILMFDADGVQIGLIETGTNGADDLGWSESGAFWVVSGWSGMDRVDAAGYAGQFTSTPLTWGWRLNITEPGDVIIADEYEMQRFDSDGNHVLASPYDSGDCYMDIAVTGGDDILSLNVYGNSLDSWDFATNVVTPTILGVPSGIDYIGVDASSTAWMGSAYGDDLYRQDGTGTELVASLNDLLSAEVGNVYGVNALEPASADSIYVLYTGSEDGIAEVTAGGAAFVVVQATGQVWNDLASR